MFLTGAGEQFRKNHNVSQIKISLTHAQHYAAANAVALG
jgi:holo-[acyl-carrier protein] synthase